MTGSKTSRSKALAALREITGPRPMPTDAPIDIFPFGIWRQDELSDSPKPRPYDDRAIALICGTVIEQGLETAILTKFVPLTDDEERKVFTDESAPLTTFDAKVRLGFALGIYGKAARDDLAAIKRIRNAFAHSRLEVSFDTNQIANVCMLISVCDRISGFRHRDNEPRERFISACLAFAIQFITMKSRPTAERPDSYWRKVLDLPDEAMTP